MAGVRNVQRDMHDRCLEGTESWQVCGGHSVMAGVYKVMLHSGNLHVI